MLCGKRGHSDHLGPWVCTEEPAQSSLLRGQYELTLEEKEGPCTGDDPRQKGQGLSRHKMGKDNRGWEP